MNAIYFNKLKTIIMVKYLPTLWILFDKSLILGWFYPAATYEEDISLFAATYEEDAVRFKY